MHITLWGENIPIAKEVCGHFGGPPAPVEHPYINLYVRVTDLCWANCPFCIAHGSSPRPFYLQGYKDVLAELYNQAYIKKVAITGGEPTSRLDVLSEVVMATKDLDPRIVVDLNTNGQRLRYMKQEVWDALGSVSLSRHHWDDFINARIFGTPRTYFDSQDIAGLSEDNKGKLHLRCNLAKGYVDSQEAVLHYMESMARLGVHDFGFVGLMGLNQWATDHLVKPQDIGLTLPLRGALPTKVQDKASGSCSCRNFVLDVLDNGLPVRYYTRWESRPDTCVASSVVYDVDRVTLGFGGKEIWGPKK